MRVWLAGRPPHSISERIYMTRIDPFRGLVSGLAGLLVSACLCFVGLICSVFIFEWMDQMPTGNAWFWFYGIVCVVLSITLGVFTTRMSYRGLTKIGAKRNALCWFGRLLARDRSEEHTSELQSRG